MTLTEFLLARIDEDEAQLAAPEFDNPKNDMRLGWAEVGGISDVLCIGEARLRAECEAKRRIAERHHPDRHLENWYWTDRKCSECGHLWHKILPFREPTEIGPEQGCATLRYLALPYAEHPDYREEWRP